MPPPSSWDPESLTTLMAAEEQHRDFPPGSTWVSGTAYDAYEPGDEL